MLETSGKFGVLFFVILFHSGAGGISMDLWGRSEDQKPIENGKLLVDKLSTTCIPPPWASSATSQTALLRIGDAQEAYTSMRVVVAGIDIDCTMKSGLYLPALVVMAMEGELSKYQPFGRVNRQCNQVRGTKCSFECVCPGNNCKFIGVHVSKEIMKSSSAKLCEVFMIKPHGVSARLAIAIDRVAANGGSDLDQLLEKLSGNNTLPAGVAAELEATVNITTIANANPGANPGAVTTAPPGANPGSNPGAVTTAAQQQANSGGAGEGEEEEEDD